MAHAAGDSTRATARSRVEISEHPQNLAAAGAITPLALERFDLVAARCELHTAHRRFACGHVVGPFSRLMKAIRRHRELIGDVR